MNHALTVMMRNPLFRLLAGSRLVYPVLWCLAQFESRWSSTWATAGLGGRVWQACFPNPDHRWAMMLHGWVAGFLWVGLMIACVVSGTGIIGAATWGVFGWLMATSIIMRHNKWLTNLGPFDGLMLAWFATYVIATAFSSYRHEALAGLFKMATFFVGWMSLRMMLTQQPKLWWVWVFTLFGLGVTEAGVGIIQHQQHVDPLATWSDTRINPDQAMTRVFGTIQPLNPNLLAGYLIPAWAAGLWIVGQIMLVPGLMRRWPWVALIGLGLTVITVGIVLSGSRGGYLGLGGMVLATFLLLWPVLKIDAYAKRKPMLMKAWAGLWVVTLAGLGLIILSNPAIATRLASITRFYEDSSIAYRLHVYSSSWRLFLDNWLVGVGPGNLVFKQVYGLYMTPGFNALGTYSVPLAVAVEQGIIGVITAAVVVKAVWIDRLLWWMDDRLSLSQRLALLAWMVGLIGLVCHGLFDTVFYRPAIHTTVWLWASGFMSVLPPFFVAPKQDPPIGQS
jgi:putative inorganic carbon (hco3(-)) transporter